jgi:hypothetical protein
MADLGPMLRATLDAVPHEPALTAAELSRRVYGTPKPSDTANLTTRLKKMHTRGLVKREGKGVPWHPYRWSRA